jgi:hypothetical protein
MTAASDSQAPHDQLCGRHQPPGPLAYPEGRVGALQVRTWTESLDVSGAVTAKVGTSIHLPMMVSAEEA